MVEVTSGESQASTFNLWNETHMLSSLDRYVLPLLDGTRDRDALLEALQSVVSMDRDALAEYIDALPQHLAEMKLLRIH
jgi:methyltransferase-like protein